MKDHALPQDVQAIRDRLMAVLQEAEAQGADDQCVFHAAARCFGETMSRLLPYELAIQFMEQELRRMRAMVADTSGQMQ
ncbi:hypothetical protein [Croceicoccus marinus]|uniref:Uncharacterized protein n=1 Tax=Croceicoccus marinus TaxID=450378 RepID=A0A7G6VRU7_9SPHN|nr:hypothetical protein [Croceicoccus marinus]QNE04462.1 hypothetical protein H4O24_10815 [Croceicoccus marinus]